MGEGGGRSSRKRHRGLRTMKSDDERIEDSEDAGEVDPSKVKFKVIMTAGEERGVGNMPPDESKCVEGVKQTPYRRGDVADCRSRGLFLRLCF